ncbi:cytochrome P450 2D14-like [Diceros bicornis minor]|uniref:cytochrome P450 2D14-like n=1 Tax=Diceros bicornis minor TaxID=77932 RepID=UPI0026EE3F6E|nr:cytochrome P450 2D14-like [Diceros bicornis minor]
MELLSGETLGSLAVALAIFLLLVDLMHQCQRWAQRYPLGPMPLPGLGNQLQVDFQDLLSCFTQMRKLRCHFRDVFSMQLPWTPVVILTGLSAMREALVYCSEDTSDHPPAPILEHLGFGPCPGHPPAELQPWPPCRGLLLDPSAVLGGSALRVSTEEQGPTIVFPRDCECPAQHPAHDDLTNGGGTESKA